MYSPLALLEQTLKATLYCVYDKSQVSEAPKGKAIYPTGYFLRIDEFDMFFNVTSYQRPEEIRLCDKSIRSYSFIKELEFTGNELDVDSVAHKPYPFYPCHSFAKSIAVQVRFDGLDKEGNTVWKII